MNIDIKFTNIDIYKIKYGYNLYKYILKELIMRPFLLVESSVVNDSKHVKEGSTILEPLSIEEYKNLFVVYKQESNFKKMVEISEKLLRIKLNKFGKYHKKTVIALLKLADSTYAIGEEDKSILLYERAISINNRIHGEDSLENASIFSLLGNIYFAMDNQDEALKYYKKALNIRQKELGELHPLTASSNHELGFFYASLEEYELALPLFESALATRVELYRMSHPQTAVSYNSLSLCYYHLFEYDKAYSAMLKAIEIKELILSADDKGLLLCRKNLVEMEKHLSFKRSFLKKLLSIFRK